jgi:Helix-turn-helix of DDE superfamily endonuclease
MVQVLFDNRCVVRKLGAMLTYDQLKTKPTTFLAITNLTVDEFDLLLHPFAQVLAAATTVLTGGGKRRRRKPGGGQKGKLPTPQAKLLFLLSYLKNYPTQTYHGLLFSLSQSKTNEQLQRLLPCLQQALARLECQPERDAQTLATRLQASLAAGRALVQDATERPRERPQEPELQRHYYSGKRQTHTDKNLLVGEAATRQVLYLSPTVEGKKHDKKLADEVAVPYPAGIVLQKDTGFQGYAPEGVTIQQPKKNRRAKN